LHSKYKGFTDYLFGTFQQVKGLELGLEAAIHGMENSRAELKKLAKYVNAEVSVEEIVWRMLNIDASVEVLARTWSVYAGAEVEDMEELEWEMYLDYHWSEDGLDDADWAAENDVDWEELEDRRMN
jgi:hypothetical protein